GPNGCHGVGRGDLLGHVLREASPGAGSGDHALDGGAASPRVRAGALELAEDPSPRDPAARPSLLLPRHAAKRDRDLHASDRRGPPPPALRGTRSIGGG